MYTQIACTFCINNLHVYLGFDRPEATNVVVLITDGRPSMSQDGSMTVHDNSVDPDSMGRRQVIEDQTIIQVLYMS